MAELIVNGKIYGNTTVTWQDIKSAKPIDFVRQDGEIVGIDEAFQNGEGTWVSLSLAPNIEGNRPIYSEYNSEKEINISEFLAFKSEIPDISGKLDAATFNAKISTSGTSVAVRTSTNAAEERSFLVGRITSENPYIEYSRNDDTNTKVDKVGIKYNGSVFQAVGQKAGSEEITKTIATMQDNVTPILERLKNLQVYDIALNGGSVAIPNGNYVAFSFRNTSANQCAMYFLRIANGALTYQVAMPASGATAPNLSYADGVLTANGTLSGRLSIIRVY